MVMWTIIAVGLVLFALLIWAAHAQNESNVTTAKRELSKVGGYHPAVVQSLGYNKASISIDPDSSRLAITVPGKSRNVFHFSQIVSVEVEKNGRSLTKTNRGSQAAGAAVGAVLLGPAGLLLGGLTGSKRTEELVKQVSLKIYTNDLISPVIAVNFLDGWSGLKADSFAVKQAAQSADQWYGRILAILQTPQRPTLFETEPLKSAASVAPSDAPLKSDVQEQEMKMRIEHKRLRRTRQANLEQEASSNRATGPVQR